MASEKQIQKILNDGISYFGKDEVYMYMNVKGVTN